MLYIDVKLKEGGKIVDPITGELKVEDVKQMQSRVSQTALNKEEDLLADNDIMKLIREKFREKFVVSRNKKG